MFFRALRRNSVARDHIDCCAARFVNLPRSALAFGFLIEQYKDGEESMGFPIVHREPHAFFAVFSGKMRRYLLPSFSGSSFMDSSETSRSITSSSMSTPWPLSTESSSSLFSGAV